MNLCHKEIALTVSVMCEGEAVNKSFVGKEKPAVSWLCEGRL